MTEAVNFVCVYLTNRLLASHRSIILVVRVWATRRLHGICVGLPWGSMAMKW